MKLNTKTSLKLISFFPLLLLLALSSYFMYISYTQYKKTQTFKDILISNRVLKELSINIAKERGLSAAFFGSNGKIAKQALEAQRKLTDRSIEKFNIYFKRGDSDIVISLIYRYLTSIKKVRGKIDKFKISFDDMFFNYYSKINSLLKQKYDKIAYILLTPKITSEVAFESKLLKEIEKSGQERGFISYIISKKIPFDSKEFSLWVKIFSETDLSNFNVNIIDQGLKKRVEDIFHNQNAKELYKTLVKAKVQIIRGGGTGNYDIEPLKWFMLMTRKIALLNNADNIVSLKVLDEANNLFNNKILPQLIISVGILVLVIFLLIVGYFIERYIIKSIQELGKLFSKVGQLANIEEEIDFQTTEGIENGYRIIEIAIDQIQQDKQIALEASRAKSIFLANMSHEIRTPLNGIIGFTELLKNTDIDGEKREFVEVIEKSSENLLEIINNILDLSKIESDKIEVEEVQFSPIEEFENAIEVFGAKAAERGIRLSFYLDPTLNNYLIGDPTKIKEVLINLLSNAIKFTPENGEIDVQIKRSGTKDAFGKEVILFSVEDNGIGISEEKIKTIFDAFSQADSTITRKYGGTGLGLTISSKFVAMMGGELKVESEEGKGSRFYFKLGFNESPSSKYNFKDGYKEFKCAILTSDFNKKRETRYLYDYLKYFGCEALFFTNYKEIKGLQFREDINFLFLDMEYVVENEIEKYTNNSIPGAFVLKPTEQFLSDRCSNEFIKVIFNPINITKIVNILDKQKELLPKSKKLKVDSHTEEDIVESEDSHRANVLVVEDNEINRKLIKRSLDNYDLNIELATNGKEAIEKVKKKRFDIIFMDIAMPIMDGVEALHAIINYEMEEGLKHTPIVALTANALKGDRERFLNEGFDEYITKPVKSSNLEAILDMFLKDKFETFTNKEKSKKEDISDKDNSNKVADEDKNSDSAKDVKYEIGDSEADKDDDSLNEDYKLKVDIDGFDENFYIEESQDDNIDSGLDEASIESKDESKSVDIDIDKNKEEIENSEINAIKDNYFSSEEHKSDEILDSAKVDTEDEMLFKDSSKKKIRALTAEDNLINQKLIIKTLRSLGLDVDVANNGKEAFEKFKENRYDIIFMDISMPVMDGIEATHNILNYEKKYSLEHTPIIALTANALPGDREAFLSEGLDEYISKPLKKEELVRVLKIFLNFDGEAEDIESTNEENEYFTQDSDEFSGLETIEDIKELTLEDDKVDKNNFKNIDVLIFKNNEIEAKILKNMISKMGHSVEYIFNFDEFLLKMDEAQYKVVMFDKDIEFVEIKDIVDKIKKSDRERGLKTVLIEFYDVEDGALEFQDDIDEVVDNIISKSKIRELLEKYLR